MMSPRWAEFERRCQKPDFRTVGHWLARYWARPWALRLTWLLVATPITPHQLTALAMLAALAGCVGLGIGTPLGWLIGSALLLGWYLLDHIDGQVARYRGTASLDGTALDYLMHHAVNLLVPLSAGFGLGRATGYDVWWLIGLALCLGLMLPNLIWDARYKAFTQRLKRLRGTLHVHGGRLTSPDPKATGSGSLPRLALHLARQLCETPSILIGLALVSLATILTRDPQLWPAQIYVAAVSAISLALAMLRVGQVTYRSEAEDEFRRRFQPPFGYQLVLHEGHWLVVPETDVDPAGATRHSARPSESGTLERTPRG
jgi:phosphatidylglycerophosphate synthase